jgi:hypothetical protein
VTVDVPWTRQNVEELARQWRLAEALLGRVSELARWLEADPPGRFEQLLDAALGRDPHTTYLRERRSYACEITLRFVSPKLAA